MSRYSISSRNGRMRATSEDRETITLFLWDKTGFGVQTADHVADIHIADLRQIVSHFDWLDDDDDEGSSAAGRHEQTEHTGILLELDSNAFADALARQIAQSVRVTVK